MLKEGMNVLVRQGCEISNSAETIVAYSEGGYEGHRKLVRWAQGEGLFSGSHTVDQFPPMARGVQSDFVVSSSLIFVE